MKLKLIRTIVFILFAAASAISVKAQSNGNTNYFQPTVFPSGPNSMAFTKFGNYPVNLYSGLPDISIPLYTVESGGLSVPITLSYHASGNKITDVASWAGLGWSINTGGSITRNVMGYPDDGSPGYLSGDMRQEDSLLMGNRPLSNNDLIFFHNTVVSRSWDNMPDIYSYQIPGYSGKFFFDGRNNYKIEKIPFSPIDITGLKSGPGFNITDDHGNKYSLGQTYREVTGTPVGGGTPAVNGISAWMLEQMISQNRRDTIKFSYTSDYLSYPDGLTESLTIEDSYQNLAAPSNTGYVTNDFTPVILDMPPSVTEQQLSNITFKNGKVNFILSSTGRQDIGNNGAVHSLSTIQVLAYNFGTKAYEVQKSIVFYQSYFNPGVTGALRLRLDSIQIKDKAGSVIQHYRFTYNPNVHLPAYGSYARDLWGYYNGKTSNTDLIPQATIQFVQNNGTVTNMTIGSSDPASRNPDSTFMQADVLNRIDYPTGGYTTFAYQTNQYYDQGNLYLAGGLRIKSISSFDSQTSITPVLVKTYQYNSARHNFINTGGPLVNNGIFQNTQTYRYWNLNNGTGYNITDQKRVRNFRAQPNEDLAPDAIPVAYSKVTEYAGTPSGNIGKTVYTYRDSPADSWQSAVMTGIPVTYSFFYARGQLLEKRMYMNKGSNNYQVVSDESHYYSAFPTRNYNSEGLAIGAFAYNDGALAGAISPVNNSNYSPDDVSSNTYGWSYYTIVSDDNYLTRTTNTTYDTSDTTKYTSSTITYQYDDTTHQQIASTTHVDSKGNTRTSTNKYAYNYAAGNAVIDTMVARHMYAEPIEKTETYASSLGTATTASELNQFQYGSFPGSIVPYKISILNIPVPVTNFTPSGVSSGSLTNDSRYTQMISFDQYDPKNNIAQYTPRNSAPVSIFWDYMFELPVAQIKNATNNNYPQVAYTSFEAPRNGGAWFYTGTPVFDATAPTGSMVYPLSAGSVTSSNFDNTTSYALSYWSNNGAATVYAGSYLSGTSYRSSNGWSYYEYTVPAGVSSISISGSTSIDELRLYPVNAQMTTYAYNPSGVTAMADTKGSINYFEYDYFGRLKNARDWLGNIVKNYGYHTYDQTAGNQAQTSTFTRNNCPSGTNPQSLTYTVPANKYYGSTVASANADATYDMNVNGQIKANQVCGCPVSQVSFTLTNYTGIGTFQVAFSGPYNHTYTFPSYGSTTIQVPAGTYTVQIYPTGDYSYHTFMLGSRDAVYAPGTTFYNVSIMPSNNETPLSIQ